VALNPVTNKIYVANQNSNNITILTEQQVQPITLTTAIAPLTDDQTTDPTLAFDFTSSSYSPSAPPVNALYLQVDTWQGAWASATSNGGRVQRDSAAALSGYSRPLCLRDGRAGCLIHHDKQRQRRR
jgi:hypothetical protein